MKHRYLQALIRFLACLSIVCALPACVSHWTVQALHALNPGAEIVESCVRDPTVEPDVSAWGHNIVLRQSKSDRDRDEFDQFATKANYLYLYDPNAPREYARLPWPYHRMTCDTVSSNAPPLPKGFHELPISYAMREAMVSSLLDRADGESLSLTEELKHRSWDKRVLGDMGPMGQRQLPMTPEKLQELGAMLRDAIRNALPMVPRENVVGPRDDQISIIDTKAGQIIGGVGSGLPAIVVPAGAIVTDAMIASGVMPEPTREFMLGKGGAETFIGLGQVIVGGSTAIGGAGATATGGGAIVGVPVCIAGVALATNGAITFINGVKTVIVAVCHWHELPAAEGPQLLASTGSNGPKSTPAPQSTGPTPAAKPAPTSTGQTPTKTTTTTHVKPPPYGNLSRAAEFGVMTEGKMAKAIAGTGLERHHLFEVRFRFKMGGDPRMKLTIAVTDTEHQAFTNEWQQKIGYGPKGTFSDKFKRPEIIAAARKIYAKYPAILMALDLL